MNQRKFNDRSTVANNSDYVDLRAPRNKIQAKRLPARRSLKNRQKTTADKDAALNKPVPIWPYRLLRLREVKTQNLPQRRTPHAEEA